MKCTKSLLVLAAAFSLHATAAINSQTAGTAKETAASPDTAFFDSMDKAVHKYQAYAKYFGFQDTASYLHFAQTMNQLIAGKHMPGLSPLHQDPAYSSTLGAGLSYADLTPEQQTALEAAYHLRQKLLAELLKVPVTALRDYMTQYTKFVDLQAKLDNIDPSLIYETTTEGKKRKIAVPTALESRWDWGGGGGGSSGSGPISVGMAVGLADFAASQGIVQYAVFTVQFESTGMLRDFSYNHFSGAFPVSNGYQPECPEIDCGAGPVPRN